jgi:hypothetical protein
MRDDGKSSSAIRAPIPLRILEMPAGRRQRRCDLFWTSARPWQRARKATSSPARRERGDASLWMPLWVTCLARRRRDGAGIGMEPESLSPTPAAKRADRRLEPDRAQAAVFHDGRIVALVPIRQWRGPASPQRRSRVGDGEGEWHGTGRRESTRSTAPSGPPAAVHMVRASSWESAVNVCSPRGRARDADEAPQAPCGLSPEQALRSLLRSSGTQAHEYQHIAVLTESRWVHSSRL